MAIFDDAKLQAARDKEAERVLNVRVEVVWLLLIAGVLLVVCANQIGFLVTSKITYGTGSVGWSPDAVRENASFVRTVGCLTFAAGLVERLALQIARIGRN